MLEVRGLCKRFGGLQAVRDVDLDVGQGSITALIGPNGAGKTTCFATIAGFIRPDAGSVRLAGHDVSGLRPDLVAARGMVRTFQVTQPFAGLTVLENIRVGAYLRTADTGEATARAREVGTRLGLEPMLGRPAAALTVAGRKRLEVARALATAPRLLLLDEVMAGLNPAEIAGIVAMIRAIAETGVTILLIEHIMQAVAALAGQVYVLAEGALIARGTPREIAGDPAVIEAYLGHGAAAPASPPMLEVSGLHAGYGPFAVLAGIDLEVGAGEIVAVLGANGAGKTTLNRVLSGLLRPTRGGIRFDGADITAAGHDAIVRAGLIHVPEGRKVFPDMTVKDNLLLGAYLRGRAGRARNLAHVIDIFPRLGQRLSQRAGSMSGGEQQMLAIGRGLMAEPRLLILDEPSLGLSPMLTDQLFALIARLHGEGLAILLVEQNVVQSLAIAGRAYVIEHGRVALSGAAATLADDPALKSAYLGLA